MYIDRGREAINEFYKKEPNGGSGEQERRKDMKKKYSNISNNIRVIGFNRMQGSKEVVNYYIVNASGKREYAFTRKYTRNTYNLVKGGIPLKDLLQVRSKDKMVMMLVKYMALMMPYFIEEIEWLAA